MQASSPLLVCVVILPLLAACGSSQSDEPLARPAARVVPAAVDAERLTAANEEPGQWMSYGRTYDEQRFSPLRQITADNVRQLGLAWYADFDTNTVQEATPLMVDGVLYVSTAWSKVNAYDALTGRQLWQFDPQVPGQWARHACCGVVNRGVAVWNGKVYVGTIDGRLIAIDAATGAPIWDVMTIDQAWPYSITGAPRVVKGKVIIGNGGADRGVRGYVSAYDAETGEQVWRWYTVPGNPADGFENDAMEMAAATWNGEWWRTGGGGTVWDGITYDPQTDLLYIGTGNGSPWASEFRSPGGGDNLFLASIVALDPDTGTYRWHYQTVPAETWDYTATAPIMAATLEIDGRQRRVVMQAPKNGYFYVLDAASGELISAENYARVNWATGIDRATGRPIEIPEARYDITGRGFILMPGGGGANSWNPMSYSPDTGLVYLPVRYNDFAYFPDPDSRTGTNGTLAAALYEQQNRPRTGTGYLLAWDPVKQEEVWRVQFHLEGGRGGGTLATAGNLVFQGTYFMGGSRPAEEFVAYRADTGERLWGIPAHTGIMPAPISYALGGEQYVAVVAGRSRSGVNYYQPNYSRLLVFKLGGSAELPRPSPVLPPQLNPPEATASAEVVTRGAAVYDNHCAGCHGADGQQAGSLFPDLRYSATLWSQEAFDAVVLEGSFAERGMGSFAGDVDPQDTQALRAYVISAARRALAAAAPGG